MVKILLAIFNYPDVSNKYFRQRLQQRKELREITFGNIQIELSNG